MKKCCKPKITEEEFNKDWTERKIKRLAKDGFIPRTLAAEELQEIHRVINGYMLTFQRNIQFEFDRLEKRLMYDNQ